ncbi:MAG: hypothetical protein OER56_11615 [Hyphomicrobiales bacterium]|nr:hypothetical protein [Hyphomicrobiales bacterium]
MITATDARLKMQQVDRLIAHGYGMECAIEEVGVTHAGYSMWLGEHNDAVPVAVDRLYHLQTENSRLRRKLAKLSLELNSVRKVRNTDVPDQPMAA